MPVGEGYWINSDTWEWKDVFEHFSAIEREPEAYGFSQEELAEIIEGSDDRIAARGNVLLAAMKRGWIRVRLTRARKVMEFWRQADGVFGAIGVFLKETGAWDTEQVELHEVATGRAWFEKAGALMAGEVFAANPTREMVECPSCGEPLFFLDEDGCCLYCDAYLGD